MEQNILKLLEEGDSAAIRLGLELLKTVEKPENGRLNTWRRLFDCLEWHTEIVEVVPELVAQPDTRTMLKPRQTTHPSSVEMIVHQEMTRVMWQRSPHGFRLARLIDTLGEYFPKINADED